MIPRFSTSAKDIPNARSISERAAQSGDDGLELVVSVDLVRPGLLHVEHLAPQGEDGLEPGVPVEYYDN